MRMNPIIAGAVLIAILLSILVVFITARPSPPAITIRHVKSVQSSNLVTETFEITNHTERSYFVFPMFLQVRKDSVWQMSPEIPSTPGRFLDAHVQGVETFQRTNLPTGSGLRAQFIVEKELTGLELLAFSLDLRFRQGRKDISLNPFKPTSRTFGKAKPIMSDEFVVPEQNGEAK